MTDNSIIVQESHFLSPAATIAEAIQRYSIVQQFARQVMKSGVDYGAIPGTGNKPTLLKPGAEKLNSLFGLAPKFPLLDKDLDWTGERHGGEPFFYFQYTCDLYVNGRFIASGVGSCNSWEKKYRYRQSDRTCPECGKATLLKSKNKPEFFCWAKRGGCGATFPLNDKRITEQETGQVKNPDPAELVNTIDKMAQKRALVAATLIATNASEYFTQDLEDLADFGHVIEGSFTEQPTRTTHEDLPPEPVEMPTGPTAVATAAPMTIEEAQNVTNSKGERYGDLNNTKLAHMANSLAKVPARTPEQETKLLAIQLIFAARNAEAEGTDN